MRGWLVGIGILLLAGLSAWAVAAGFFNADSVYPFGIDGTRRPVAAVFLSDTMGLRMGMGMGSVIAPALSAHGIAVLGISSPAAFTARHSQAEVDRLLAGAIDSARTRTGATRVILMGQSFGADIVAAGLTGLSPGRRAHIAAVVLITPAQNAYFRADPLGLRYLGKPDARPAEQVRDVNWSPVICIYGSRESDSLCPTLIGTQAMVLELAGGHSLDRDDHAVVDTILNALHVADPTMGMSRR